MTLFNRLHRLTLCHLLTILICTLWSFSCGTSAQEDEDSEAAASVAEPERVNLSVAERKQQSISLLADSLPADQIVWLQSADSQFFAIQRKAWVKQPKGFVLMIHGSGEHPYWPGPLANAQNFLPLKGWQTLSIALPDPAEKKLPKRPKTTNMDNSDGETIEPTLGDNESNEIFDDSRERISDGSHSALESESMEKEDTEYAEVIEATAQDRILSALNYIKANNIKRITVYAQGTGAARVGQYLRELPPSDHSIHAIILVDALNTTPVLKTNLAQDLTNPRLAIRDYLLSNHLQVQKDAQQRLQQTRSNQFTNYRQKKITSSTDALNLAIYGFLKSLSP